MPKKYEIEGGRWVTVPQLVEELGQDKDLMAIEKLKKPRNKYKQRFKPKTVKTKPKEAEKKYDYQYKVADVIKQRMYFDPLGHWKLLNNMGKKA